jgi:hypothetical protein
VSQSPTLEKLGFSFVLLRLLIAAIISAFFLFLYGSAASRATSSFNSELHFFWSVPPPQLPIEIEYVPSSSMGVCLAPPWGCFLRGVTLPPWELLASSVGVASSVGLLPPWGFLRGVASSWGCFLHGSCRLLSPWGCFLHLGSCFPPLNHESVQEDVVVSISVACQCVVVDDIN